MEQSKKELLKELTELLNKNSMCSIDGINSNSKKIELINAIKCLKYDDELLNINLNIVKKTYPHIHISIIL